ncbi:MAG: cysteine desulfurase family protein [Flavobacteriaceae bacterium]|nr:cysteine desulfurase family protein [Flavobacteriaceae bacterium]
MNPMVLDKPNINNTPLYLDNASTTPIDDRVYKEMEPYFKTHFGNPSSKNHHSLEPQKAIKKSREKISELIGSIPNQIIFNSGSTEGINHVLKSLFFSSIQNGKNHLVISSVEHKAVIETANYLNSIGCEVTKVGVDKNGIIDLKMLSTSLTDKTFLVCVMLVNNETGVVQPVSEVISLAKSKNIPVFSDATQAIGKLSVDVVELDIDYLCFNSHKINGPKGVGALYIKSPSKLTPLIHGGGQEDSLRGGTYNVPGIVGFGKAADILVDEMTMNIKNYKKEKSFIIEDLIGEDGKENFINVNKVPNIISMTLFKYENEEYLLRNKTLFSASIGSACSAKIIQESHVLKAIPGINPNKVIRISI